MQAERVIKLPSLRERVISNTLSNLDSYSLSVYALVMVLCNPEIEEGKCVCVCVWCVV